MSTPATGNWSAKYAEGCEWCGTRIPAIKAKGKSGSPTRGLEAAHIIAREYGPEHEWNVFILCPTCHKIFDEVIKPRVQAALEIAVTGYPKKIVLHCPSGYGSNLDAVVGEFIRDGVIFIGVVGRDCVKIEEIIDELVVGDGERNCHLLTSSHPNETVEDAVRFAASLTGEFKGEVHVIEI
jgi:hypothetical protein